MNEKFHVRLFDDQLKWLDMDLKKILIIGGVAAAVLILGFIYLLYNSVKVVHKEVTDQKPYSELLNQDFYTKAETALLKLDKYIYIKEPYCITENYYEGDPIERMIPAGTKVRFTKAFSRYSAVAGSTTVVLVGDLTVEGKTYRFEWNWDGTGSENKLFAKTEK